MWNFSLSFQLCTTLLVTFDNVYQKIVENFPPPSTTPRGPNLSAAGFFSMFRSTFQHINSFNPNCPSLAARTQPTSSHEAWQHWYQCTCEIKMDHEWRKLWIIYLYLKTSASWSLTASWVQLVPSPTFVDPGSFFFCNPLLHQQVLLHL